MESGRYEIWYMKFDEEMTHYYNQRIGWFELDNNEQIIRYSQDLESHMGEVPTLAEVLRRYGYSGYYHIEKA